MSRTGSNYEPNRVEQRRIINRTRTNRESSRVESCIEWGRIMDRPGSDFYNCFNQESQRVESLDKQSRTKSNYGSSGVESRFERMKS